ncbi:MAG: DUF4242 domain-containing protein, partial [Chloroflexi bacterium]|nr:DUF4242 domain-containing protein [Chloroflexota bacterium]
AAVASARARFAAYYAQLAEEFEPELWGPAVAAGTAALDREFENLSAAGRWAIQQRDAELALRFGAALWHFWEVRGRAAQGLRWLDEALALPGEAPALVKGRALDAAGHLALSLGQHHQAARYFVRTLQTWLQAGSRQSAALALNNLSTAALYGGDTTASTVHLTASSDLFRELKDEPGLALTLVTLGTTAHLQGNADSARTLYEEGLRLFRKLGDSRGVAGCLNNLANLLDEAGQTDRARALYAEALQHYRELGDTREQAAALANMAATEQAVGRTADAAELCRQSLDLYDELADGRGVLTGLGLLAQMAAAQEQFILTARLLGAMEVLRSLTGVPAAEHAPASVAELERLAAGRLKPELLAAARAQGARLALNEMIDEAVTSLKRNPSPNGEETMSRFLVERYLPGFTADQLAGAAAAAKKASAELSAQGTPVRYLRSTFVPGQEKCFCLFEGPSAEAVRQANERASLPFDSIAEAVHVAAEEVA